MWELDHKEGCMAGNWCFWTVVLEKTLESPLGSKEIQPVHPKGNQSWIFIGRTDAEAESPILWPPDAESWLIGKDPDAGQDWRQEKGTAGDEMVGWHHQLNGHEFEQTLELWRTGELGVLHSMECRWHYFVLSCGWVIFHCIYVPYLLYPFLCVDHNKLWKILKDMEIPDPLTCLLRNLYADQEATVRTGHGTMDCFQIGKGVRQGCTLPPCLFNLSSEYIRQKLLGWMKPKRESRLPGEISIASDMQMIPPLWQKVKRN